MDYITNGRMPIPNVPPIEWPRRVKTGPTAWLSLPDELLNDEGKTIVTEDPNLSPDTLKRLIAAHPPIDGIEFLFGDSGDEDDTDIGLTSISMCINENVDSSMAELVARYAEMRTCPFTNTAIAVLDLYRRRGLYRFVPDNNMYNPVEWHPKSQMFVKPPSKKKPAVIAS